MISTFAEKSRKKPTWMMLQHSVLRNFGGLDDTVIKPWEIFEKKLEPHVGNSGVGDEFQNKTLVIIYLNDQIESLTLYELYRKRQVYIE